MAGKKGRSGGPREGAGRPVEKFIVEVRNEVDRALIEELRLEYFSFLEVSEGRSKALGLLVTFYGTLPLKPKLSQKDEVDKQLEEVRKLEELGRWASPKNI